MYYKANSIFTTEQVLHAWSQFVSASTFDIQQLSMFCFFIGYNPEEIYNGDIGDIN